MSSSVQFYLAIFIFLMTYAGIMSEKIHRTICALAGGGAMIYFGLVTQEQAITEFIDFNTLGLLTGMMILISVVKQSGFFHGSAPDRAHDDFPVPHAPYVSRAYSDF